MNTIPAIQAQSNLDNLIRQVAADHEPVLIAGKAINAVLVSQDDWLAIQETLHLLSIPGMRESIRMGMETPLDQCQSELVW